jgi:CheY-like chemotaxis protein
MNILMVEDNRGDVVLIQEAMTKLGLEHRLTVVSDGVESMNYLLAQEPYANVIRPDLIVLDLKLPRKNGREVLEAIDGNPDWRTIPVVVLSSSRSELELAKAIDIPLKRYMVKPSTFAGYVELVRSIEAFYRQEGGARERRHDEPK